MVTKPKLHFGKILQLQMRLVLMRLMIRSNVHLMDGKTMLSILQSWQWLCRGNHVTIMVRMKPT